MISKIYGEYVLVCDVCGEREDWRAYPTYQDAVDKAQEGGWRMIRQAGEWGNVCPECTEGEI